MDLKRSLYGLDPTSIQKFLKSIGSESYRATQLLDWIYKKNIGSFEEAKTLPADLKKSLAEHFDLHSLSLKEKKDSSNGESIKFLFETRDGKLLESVLILQQDRRTVCLSTQLGCKMGCVFCASGKGKFNRNLTPGEIVEQVAWIQRLTKKPVTNIVFMGMGEPLDNFEATMKALEILQAPWGFFLGARRITVSTSGITPKIVEFVKRQEGRVRLSVSLHSSNPQTRSQIVPINRRYTLDDLCETLWQIHEKLKREITFEYTLISGVNDSREEAIGVAKIAKPLRAKVNLIPYNPIREMDFKTPSKSAIENFAGILERQGIKVTIRQTAGRDIDAACGQLRLDREEINHLN